MPTLYAATGNREGEKMRAVVQRVTHARVEVDGTITGQLDTPGLCVLVGVTHDDGPAQVDWLARKIADLRLLDGERSVAEAAAPVLVVSQFTLYADVRKGRRPSWSAAAPGPVAEPIITAVVEALRTRGITVATGTFGAHMAVHLVNDGPVTLILEAPSG